MKKLAIVALVLGLAMLFSATSLRAQVMGICTGWPWLPSAGCTLATPALEIGSTGNPNPTFFIGTNDGGVTSDTYLMVLKPQPSTTGLNSLTFDATFTQNSTTHVVNATAEPGNPPGPFISNQELVEEYLQLTCDVSYPGGSCSGVDYHFNSINNLQIVAGTQGYTVYLLKSGFGVKGPTPKTGGPLNVHVAFSNFSGGATGFPLGTMFLALGVDSAGNVIFKTPLTLGLEIVPEPGTMLLMGSGLLGIGALLRKKLIKRL